MSQPSQPILSKQITNTLNHAKSTSQLSSSEVSLPLNSSTYTQNAMKNTASVKSLQPTNQFLGAWGPKFQHHIATLPTLQISTPSSWSTLTMFDAVNTESRRLPKALDA